MMTGWINSTYLALTPAKKAQLKSENTIHFTQKDRIFRVYMTNDVIMKITL